MDAQDDEALARELHRELNVGPRRRQRRPPPPPRKREAQGKRERPDAESTEDGSTTEDSDDFSTRVPQKTSPGVSQQRTEPLEQSGDVRQPNPPPTQNPAALAPAQAPAQEQAPPAALQRSATAPAPMQQRYESTLAAGAPPDTSGIRPKLKAAMPGTPLAKSKSVQPTSARKHPSSGSLASPPTKKHKPTALTPTRAKQPVKEPAQQPAVAVQSAAPTRPPLAPDVSPRLPITAGNLLKTPKKQATSHAAPSTSPDKASAPLPLVFKGPGVVRPSQMSTTMAPMPADAPAAGPALGLQIAPLHLKQDLVVPGSQPPREQPPQSLPARAPAGQATPDRPPIPPTAAKVPPLTGRRDPATLQPPAGSTPMPTPVSLVQPQTGAAVVLPVARLSPGRVPKEKSPSRNLLPEKSPSKDEKSPAKAEKLPAKAEKSPAKSDKSPVKAERSTAKAGRAPPKSEPSTNASSEPGDRREGDRPGARLPLQPSIAGVPNAGVPRAGVPRPGVPRPQEPAQQATAMAENHTPVEQTAQEAIARKAAYDWLHSFPPDYVSGSFLCQEAGSLFSVWLQTEDSSSRAALGGAVASLYPLCTATSTSCEEFTVTMVDMRTRRYFHFPPRSEKSSQEFVPWRDAVAKTTHMLLHRAGET